MNTNNIREIWNLGDQTIIEYYQDDDTYVDDILDAILGEDDCIDTDEFCDNFLSECPEHQQWLLDNF